MSSHGRDASPAPARLTHDAVQALISARLDAPLDAASNRALLAHLATCPTCRAFAEQMDAMSRGLRELPHLPPSPTVSRQVRERLAAGRPWWSGLPLGTGNRLGGVQAAAMMLILLGAVAAVLLVRMLSDNGGTAKPPGTIDAASITATLQAVQTASPSVTATETAPTAPRTPTPTRTPRPSATSAPINVQVTLTPTPSPTATTQPTVPPTDTPAPTDTPTPAPTSTSRPTKTATAKPSPAETATPDPTASVTAQPTEPPTVTATDTPEPTPTETPTATATAVPTQSPTPRPTATATVEPTSTPVPPSETPTQEPTSTATEQPSATSTAPTQTPEPTQTETPRPTRPPRSTRMPTPTVEPTQTGTPPIIRAQRTPAGEQPTVGAQIAEQPTETPTGEAARSPASGDTTQAQNTGAGQTIQPRHSPTADLGGRPTQVPFQTSGNGTGGETSAPAGPTDTPTEGVTPKATQPPTKETTAGAGGAVAGATAVADFPDGAGATAGLRFAADGAFFALDLGGRIVVADAAGRVAASLPGLSPVWSPRGLVLLYADGRGGVAVWDREAGQSISISDRTRGTAAVADFPAGWSDATLVYLRIFRDRPGHAELHGAGWDGSNDRVLWTGDLGDTLARPVVTARGVWVLARSGWVLIGLDGSASAPQPNPWGVIGDPVASPFGSAVAFAVGGRMAVVSADNPWVPLWDPVPAPGGFAYSPDGKQLVVADGAGLAIYDLGSGALVSRFAAQGATAPGWSTAGIFFVQQGDRPALCTVSLDAFASA